jgi:hypothetical protein
MRHSGAARTGRAVARAGQAASCGRPGYARMAGRGSRAGARRRAGTLKG